MADVRRVAVTTFGRSDFSILRPLVARLADHPGFEVGFWVGGAHFDPMSGPTVVDVEASGLPIWARIDPGPYDRTPRGTVEVMAAQLRGFAVAADAPSGAAGAAAGVELVDGAPVPDLVLILGDRFEAVAAGLAMVPLGIPVGHISGGSITEGAIDDVFRHCLTQIAALHFCDLPEFARRIQLMGAPPATIFTTGALGLDALTAARPRPFAEFAASFGFESLRPGYTLATLHPESRRPEATGPMAAAMVAALRDSGRQAVITHPNADPGSDLIVEVIEAAADGRDVFCVRNFGTAWYPTAMAHAGLMVGNSSGGIIEAATFGLPVVDIGDRQRGRVHGPNVLHSGRERDEISAAIDTASGSEFAARAASGNIYGDGRGAERVVAALDAIDWSTLAEPVPFADPVPEFAGARLELP